MYLYYIFYIILLQKYFKLTFYSTFTLVCLSTFIQIYVLYFSNSRVGFYFRYDLARPQKLTNNLRPKIASTGHKFLLRSHIVNNKDQRQTAQKREKK